MLELKYILMNDLETAMITTSEIAVTITIWALTAAGTFFGGRAAWRRKKRKLTDESRDSSP